MNLFPIWNQKGIRIVLRHPKTASQTGHIAIAKDIFFRLYEFRREWKLQELGGFCCSLLGGKRSNLVWVISEMRSGISGSYTTRVRLFRLMFYCPASFLFLFQYQELITCTGLQEGQMSKYYRFVANRDLAAFYN